MSAPIANLLVRRRRDLHTSLQFERPWFAPLTTDVNAMESKSLTRIVIAGIFLLYFIGYFALRATHQMRQTGGAATITQTHFEFRAAAEKPLQCSLFYLYYPLGYLDKRITGRGYELIAVTSPGGFKRTAIE